MKKILFLLAVFLDSALAAQQQTYDPFNYTVGATIGGQTTPNGFVWSEVGSTNPGPDITVVADNLIVPGLFSSSGNAIRYGTNGSSGRLTFASSTTSNTLYYSLTLRVDALGTLINTGGFMAGFNNTPGAQPNTPTVVGTKILTRATGTGGYNIGLVKMSTAAANFSFDSRVFNLGETVFLVGSYSFLTGSGTDDISRMWINPDPSTFGLGIEPPSTLTNSIGTDLATIASFVVLQRNNPTLQPEATILDELRIGNSWPEVTPVPEPSGLVLAGLTLGILFFRKRLFSRIPPRLTSSLF